MSSLLIAILLIVGLFWLVGHGRSKKTGTAQEPNRDARRMSGSTDRWRAASGGAPLPSTQAEWILPGQTATVGGLTLPDGMIYVGTELPAIRHWGGPDPALINPRLAVDHRNPDRACDTMSYWPSYSDIRPEARGGYLAWLSGGRRDPDVGIGHVFLYFYGLERRLLHDGVALVEGTERNAILAELDRLLELYGENGSFRGYASRLIGILRAASALSGDITEEPPAEYLRPRSEAWFPVRLALGRLATEGKPLPAGWALAWVFACPDLDLRMPATRCAPEFSELFRVQYRQKHGDGLLIRPNKTALRMTYTPASASFGGEVSIRVSPEIPDVGAQRAAFSTLRDLAEECTTSLESYSRWLGRNPDERDNLAGLALLPKVLLPGRRQGTIGEMAEWLSKHLASTSTAVVAANDLIGFWMPSPPDKLAKADAVAFAVLCEKLGYALEPDVRFGGPPLSPEGKAVLFRVEAEAAAAPSAAYKGATVLLHLAAAVAAADGSIAPEETDYLASHLQQCLQLNLAERGRLQAHMLWLLETRPSLAGLRKRLEAISVENRRSFGEFVIGVAGANGSIAPEEVDMLRKIYPLLGLDPEDVFGHIHALTSGSGERALPAEGPVTVRPAAARTPGYCIPKRPAPQAAVVLDMQRVQAKLNETAAVAALLGDVFTEDDLVSTSQESAEAGVAPHVATLDMTQAVLLNRLASQKSWSRSQVEALTAQLGLLPDGALEAINDAAFEKCGSAVLEGDDPIEVNQDIYRELLA